MFSKILDKSDVMVEIQEFHFLCHFDITMTLYMNFVEIQKCLNVPNLRIIQPKNCEDNLQICCDLTFAFHMVDCLEVSVKYH